MRDQSGFSLAEVLVMLTLVGFGLGVTALYLRPMEAPLQTAASLLEGTFRAARLKAMATTSAFRVEPDGSGGTSASYAASCSAGSWTTEPDLALEFPPGVTMTGTDWSVCFSSRGISSSNVTIVLAHPQHGSRAVEVLLGGTTKVHS